MQPLRLAALVLAATTIGGCTIAMDSVATEPPAGEGSGGPRAPGTNAPRATVDVAAAANEAAFGPWRRAAVRPAPAFAAAAEAACRGVDLVGELPLVLVDARGEGVATLVLADHDAAVVCDATLTEQLDATAEAHAIPGYPGAGPLDAESLGIRDLEVIESGIGGRMVLVGRVGSDVARVAAQFEDASWSNATMADGWYAMWWPGRDPALQVAAVNVRSEALDGFAPSAAP